MRRGRFVKPGYLALSPKAFGLEFAFFERPAREVTTVGNVAVVEITGPLTHRSDYFWDSYEGIEARARAAFESDARAVCLRIDSPGGDVAGCFELARALRNMSAESGKELVAFCEGLCASAAYALACGATRIVAPGTANVGSIGVFEAMVDTVAADVAMGVRFIMVASGARKLDGHPHVPPTEAGVAAMQEKIDILAEQFFDLVAELRGLDPVDVRAIEGELLVAPQALTRGLIDSLGVYAETLESLQGETSMPVPPAKIATTARAGGTIGKAKKCSDEEWKALRTLSESENEDHRKMAKKMLATMVDDGEEEHKEGEGEGRRAEGEEHKEKEGEGEGKRAEGKHGEARAEGEDEKEKEREKAKAAAAAQAAQAAAAQAPSVLELARELHQIKVERANEKEAEERKALLAQRPDFAAEVVKTLSAQPIEVLRDAVANWPKGPKARSARPGPAGLAVSGTRGRSQGVRGAEDEPPEIDDDDPAARGGETEEAYIARKMGQASIHGGIHEKNGGRSLELGFMTPAEAQAKLAEIEKRKNAGASPEGSN